MKRTHMISIEFDSQVCANCKHFYQHYVLDSWSRSYKKIHLGHCVYPRQKEKMVTNGCAHFEPRREIG